MFEKAFPYYLSLGMDFTQYWEGDSWLTKAYRDASEIKNQRMSEKLWLQGYYNFQAFSTALSNLNFSKKKRKLNEYMKEPIRLLPLTEQEKKQRAEIERQKVIDYFNNLAKKWNKK